MELFSAEFFSALAAIIVIDLVLAGDNAIVIALAARKLPDHLRTRAVVWGTFGAIAVRAAMTLIVVWLLKVPGLLLLGGALLVWIAYALLVNGGESDHKVEAAGDFWGAMRTIIVADAVMGLDNVLGVAGAAQGSFLLVVLGLLVSIPIVIWGSQVILKYVQRFPAIVYFGAGVLAWTAAKMMMGEPLVKIHFEQSPLLTGLAYLATVGGVLAAGFRFNHGKARSRVLRHVVELAAVPAVPRKPARSTKTGGATMMKILVPVDGSPNSLAAVRHVINRFMSDHELEIHVLHVRTPLSQYVSRFVSRRNRAAWHREEAEKALGAARDMLERFGVPYAAHVELGDKAAVIDRVAQRLRVNQIAMGSARKNSLTRLVEDSVTNRVLELTPVPVEVIAGHAVSPWERYGIPLGLGSLLALLLAAVVD
jgi:YjbE family integral membrane protein